MNEWPMYVIVCLVWGLLVGLALVMPSGMRKGVFFGINLPAEALSDPKVGEIERRYKLLCVGIGTAIGALLLVILYTGGEQVDTAVILVGTLLAAPVSLGIYLYAHNSVKKLKLAKGWKTPTSRFVAADISAARRPKGISGGWYLLILGLIALNAGIIASLYDQIPDVMNLHYNMAGEVDRTAPKSFFYVFLMNFIQLGMAGFMYLMHLTANRIGQRLDPQAPRRSLEDEEKARKKPQLILLFSTLAIVLEFGIVQFGIIELLPGPVMAIAAIAIPLLIVIMAIVTHQKMDYSVATEALHPNDDDKYWKAGLFYHNPSDPSLIVEKRVGIGWTINTARPAGWLLVLTPLILAAVVLILSWQAE
ncbi:DUF1648 domain-containing protein [Paenibacillus puerhi]|uniref:DUF1648 domain-containing protein n=1 Tax=Paenibacillus puerhi TaxID=2692622 RepID=UPI001357E091|nr:DUF5808 domain-containing protein [Paenibacillus puerhi]